MSHQELLERTVRSMCTRGKGILAADESTGTIAKRFEKISVENNEENRRFYREILFTTPGMAEFICGVILYEETLGHKTQSGVPFAKVLTDAGVVPGIKVDRGAVAFTGSGSASGAKSQEKITEGLDGLPARMEAFRAAGARFAKWRAVIAIGPSIPSDACIHANAHALARYASICQGAGIVPIVEPEVLMDGDHTIERCYQVTEHTLHTVFAELHRQNVVLEHMILKPNMVIAAKDCRTQASPEQIAEQTIRCFQRTVPSAVPGIFFLSGGQSDEEASVNLNAINAKFKSLPWMVSFSYGRALQSGALAGWKGVAANLKAAQKAFFHRAKLNSAAQLGKYQPSMEKELVKA
jgi:fructose-bisphosphate aldolase class I